MSRNQKPQHIGGKNTGKTQKPRADYTVQISAYVEAFGKHYSAHSVEVKPGKNRDGETVFHVSINGDKGDRPLTLQDMQEATQAFLH